MSNKNTPSKEAPEPPQQASPASGEEKGRVVCPYCTQKMNYLMTMVNRGGKEVKQFVHTTEVKNNG